MPEPVAAQMLAAVPPRHDNDLARDPLAFQHPQDHHPRPAFAVVSLERRAVWQDHAPSIMGRLCKFLDFTQTLNEISRVVGGATGPARDRVF